MILCAGFPELIRKSHGEDFEMREFMEVSRVHDISVLHLFGEVSFLEVDQIERVINNLREAKNHKIILDMTSVDHIHYMVVKRLIASALELRSANGDIKIVNLNPETREIFRFTGADQYLEDYATISEGILSFLKKSAVDRHYYQ